MDAHVEQWLEAYGDMIEEQARSSASAMEPAKFADARPGVGSQVLLSPRARSLVLAGAVIGSVLGVVAWSINRDAPDRVTTTAPSPVAGTNDEPPAEPTPLGDPGNDPAATLRDRVAPAIHWTGSEVLVFGGFEGDLDDDREWLLDGAAYDPDLDVWRTLRPAPMDDPVGPSRTLWDGTEMVLVADGASMAYDPAQDLWRALDDPVLPYYESLPQGGDVDISVLAASNGFVYHWNPASDEFARLDVAAGHWTKLAGPGLNVYPAQLVVDGDRVVAFGTGWPSSFVPVNFDLVGAEWTDGRWREIAPINFKTDEYANAADPRSATLLGDEILVWGDTSPSPGPARILDAAGQWISVAPPPLCANTARLQPISLGDTRLLALSECGKAAIWDHPSSGWTSVEPPEFVFYGGVWTGAEIVGWRNGLRRWTPPSQL